MTPQRGGEAAADFEARVGRIASLTHPLPVTGPLFGSFVPRSDLSGLAFGVTDKGNATQVAPGATSPNFPERHETQDVGATSTSTRRSPW